MNNIPNNTFNFGNVSKNINQGKIIPNIQRQNLQSINMIPNEDQMIIIRKQQENKFNNVNSIKNFSRNNMDNIKNRNLNETRFNNINQD